ncbi:Macro domain-containing protein [Phytophthora citrophthora]|uniref:Macro domain-containing protein n=1 Tax=Phytophthora citrophthora TaxID=4793 RepID=A0AAD9GC53_9STRA|nr:Macro domain-containing protein [Phytophthora citrophthora]
MTQTKHTNTLTNPEVWAVEGVVHSVLFYLDTTSLDNVVSYIQATTELHDYLKDSELWTKLSEMHFGGRRPSELQVEHRSSPIGDWEWTNRDCTCVQLEEFLRSFDDWKRFDSMVAVVEGDIERIDSFNDKPLDGIAFPTNSYLLNPHVAAAGAVFRRAGTALEQFIGGQSFRERLGNWAGWLPVGSALASPGFEAGVKKLIHCVGPSVNEANCYELLATTYENALNCMVDEDLHCVGMVSISTGNLGVPCAHGAKVAMRMLQKFATTRNWDGTVAIVCNEESVLQAFAAEKTAMLKNFNVIQTLPAGEFASMWSGNHELA